MSNVQALFAPGAPFELAIETVLGERMHVFKRRRRSLRDLVAASDAFGDREFLVFGDRRLTFAEHGRQVASVASALRERGVGKGDRVAILGANSVEWIVTFFATVSLGAIAVGMNGWWTADEIGYALADSTPKLLVGDSKRLDRIRSAKIACPVVEMETDFAALTRSDAALPDVAIAEDDPAVILYTSGTTGRPKGATSSHRNILALLGIQSFHGARLFMDNPPKAPPVRLSSTPLFHVSGLYSGVIPHLAAGVKSVWTTGRFDPAQVLELIERERVTGWAPHGSMAWRVLNHPGRDRYDVSSVDMLGSGGAPVTPELQAALRDAFPNARLGMAVGYGLTEATALATINYGEELARHPTSVGKPLPTVEVEIRDGDEIFIRGPLVMLGYWQNPEATAQAIGPGRWLRTGDIGRMQDGRLYLASRKRDLILRGAENVYPAEVEQRLEAHPAVAEAAVVGVASAEYGQEVKAIVVPRAGVHVDFAAIERFVGETLAYYKVPRHWQLRDAPLPRNASGKVMKFVLTGDAGSPLVDEE